MIKWLYPGMHVKRWLLLLMFGIVVIGLGIDYVLRELYDSVTFPDFVYYVTLQFLPRFVRAALFFAVGVGTIALAIARLNSSLLSPFLTSAQDLSLVDRVYRHHMLRRGPKIVAVGGGTGLSTLLRGLKQYTGNLTAIVTMADDGGSSGRLRRELGVPPPGDFRQCLAALADAEPLMSRLLQHRFTEGMGLGGHSFGNLFIVAMAEVTGTFERAIHESCRVLAVRGQVLPSTLADVTLCAEFEGDEHIAGESRIGEVGKPIRRAYLRPEHPPAYPEAVRAVRDADLIVIGPGSLYTSILPNLLVQEIARTVKASSALKVYVCNVATQRGETENYRVIDHVQALEHQLGEGLFQYVVVNSNLPARTPDVQPVVLSGEEAERYHVVEADVADPQHPRMHQPLKLAQALMRLYYDRASGSGLPPTSRADADGRGAGDAVPPDSLTGPASRDLVPGG
ncbi:MAG: YvcK family protein [Chloroflexi bacterium]|nr:YvcK family protein [Chloroflexota bacterium]